MNKRQCKIIFYLLIVISICFCSCNDFEIANEDTHNSENFSKTENVTKKKGNEYLNSYDINTSNSSIENKPESSEEKADVTLSLGYYHSACISNDGKLWVWGNNDDDRLGLETTEIATEDEEPISSIPVELKLIDDSDGIRSINLGFAHSAVITNNGSLYLWGNNSWYECGVGGLIHTQSTPKKVLDDVVKVSLGNSFSAAITKDESLYMWGDNSLGVYGNGTIQSSSKPIKVMDNVKDVALGRYYTVILTNDGSVYTCGLNDSCQLGCGSETKIEEHDGMQYYNISSTPIKIMDNVKSISCGYEHTAVIKNDDSLYMWGLNSYGQLGNKTTENSSIPIKVMDDVKQVSLGGAHSAVITKNGDLYMFGLNDKGQLGIATSEIIEKEDKTVSISTYPIKIMSNVNCVSLGAVHSAAITEKGYLYMWGLNCYGQLGNGTTENSEEPIKVMDNVMLS